VQGTGGAPATGDGLETDGGEKSGAVLRKTGDARETDDAQETPLRRLGVLAQRSGY